MQPVIKVRAGGPMRYRPQAGAPADAAAASKIQITGSHLRHSVSALDDQKTRSARLRRRRGYRWEEILAKRFNGAPGWRAFRLGSPSIALPDVLAVNTAAKSMYIIEAKSGAKTSLSVPPNQIERCLSWRDTFDIYDSRTVVLAFKFLAKKRLDTDRYESRSMREYYKVWEPALDPVETVCTYAGGTYALVDGERHAITLADCPMPFAEE